jgi:hypothetical protein
MDYRLRGRGYLARYPIDSDLVTILAVRHLKAFGY